MSVLKLEFFFIYRCGHTLLYTGFSPGGIVGSGSGAGSNGYTRLLIRKPNTACCNLDIESVVVRPESKNSVV